MDISVGTRIVGDGQPCLIVAEAGENHVNNVDIACALIEQAALAGADAIKFQTHVAEELYNPSTPNYARRVEHELPFHHYSTMLDVARANDIILFSTPFDEPSADFLDELGVDLFKIGSGELTHFAMLRHIAKLGKPMVISTGMGEQQWIENAVRVVKDAGNDQIVIAHCVSVYPAPVHLSNVRAVPALRDNLGVLTGLSDHTMSSSAAMAAVALGACYIEKHFALSRALPEGDNDMSNEPGEFKAMVEGIREVEASLGTGERSLLPEEADLVKIARRGVYARFGIQSGQRIEGSMLAVRRPLSEIAADQIDRVVGATAKTDIAPEQPVRWADIAE
jgi:N-acetylneuraminate synthase/N,N'-diacetyllegionaminate synthase